MESVKHGIHLKCPGCPMVSVVGCSKCGEAFKDIKVFHSNHPEYTVSFHNSDKLIALVFAKDNQELKGFVFLRTPGMEAILDFIFGTSQGCSSGTSKEIAFVRGLDFICRKTLNESMHSAEDLDKITHEFASRMSGLGRAGFIDSIILLSLEWLE